MSDPVVPGDCHVVLTDELESGVVGGFEVGSYEKVL